MSCFFVRGNLDIQTRQRAREHNPIEENINLFCKNNQVRQYNNQPRTRAYPKQTPSQGTQSTRWQKLTITTRTSMFISLFILLSQQLLLQRQHPQAQQHPQTPHLPWQTAAETPTAISSLHQLRAGNQTSKDARASRERI